MAILWRVDMEDAPSDINFQNLNIHAGAEDPDGGAEADIWWSSTAVTPRAGSKHGFALLQSSALLQEP